MKLAINHGQIHQDFFNKGHALFEQSNLDKYIDLESIDWIEGKGHLTPKVVSTELKAQLTTLHWYLATQIIAPIFSDFCPLKNEIWNGINESAHQWHCDYEEGHNLVFLLYFSDMKSDGFLWTKTPNETISKIIPKRGTLVMLNNWPGFMHRVDKTHDTRIVADFRFKIFQE